MAAFNVVLHGHTRQTDLIVGTDLANRSRHELENLIVMNRLFQEGMVSIEQFIRLQDNGIEISRSKRKFGMFRGMKCLKKKQRTLTIEQRTND